MTDGASDLAGLAERLSAHGLFLRSGFNFKPSEEAPAKAVLLVGNVGASYWPHFQSWLNNQPPSLANPLDTWSRTVISAAAATVGARAVSPSDKPYWPFQQWAMRAEGLKPSPLGILLHPDYGLWHAFRGALLFDQPLPLEASASRPHLCDLCPEKPCLHACPVGAHSVEGFAYERCVALVRSEATSGDAFPYSVPLRGPPLPPPEGEEWREPAELGLSSPSGGGRGGPRSGTEWGNHLDATTAFHDDRPAAIPCRTAGCQDRNACPVGTAYRYPTEVQAFHTAAFARL